MFNFCIFFLYFSVFLILKRTYKLHKHERKITVFRSLVLQMIHPAAGRCTLYVRRQFIVGTNMYNNYRQQKWYSMKKSHTG